MGRTYHGNFLSKNPGSQIEATVAHKKPNVQSPKNMNSIQSSIQYVTEPMMGNHVQRITMNQYGCSKSVFSNDDGASAQVGSSHSGARLASGVNQRERPGMKVLKQKTVVLEIEPSTCLSQEF